MVTGIRRNLSQGILDDLLARIGRGDLVSGDRLPTEHGLMQAYGVGRNTVREAIQTLAAMRLVDVRPGRGAVVVSVDSATAADSLARGVLLNRQAVTDLYEFRASMEVDAAARAAERATAQQLERIEESFTEYRHAYDAGHDTYLADLAFHRAVVAASNNVVYLQIIDTLGDLLASARRSTQRVPGAERTAVREHDHILTAVRDQDTAAAHDAMATHIRSAQEALNQVLREGDPDVVDHPIEG